MAATINDRLFGVKVMKVTLGPRHSQLCVYIIHFDGGRNRSMIVSEGDEDDTGV